ENVIIGHLIPAGTGIKYYENIDVVHQRRVMDEQEYQTSLVAIGPPEPASDEDDEELQDALDQEAGE
ncbi:MAG: hypothetical protein F6K39_16185, partial [Okeania sp. SIO3B3]|nr:hypothetical protein [Okeania sp. SIO3B3]